MKTPKNYPEVTHEEIEAKTKEYLKCGGKIKKIGVKQSGQNPHRRSGYEELFVRSTEGLVVDESGLIYQDILFGQSLMW